MDPFTHMFLGACIGQAIGYKKFGGKALVFGAVAAGLPDIDVLWTPFTGEYGSWKYHRHVTHALWFGPIIGALLGWGLWKHYAREYGRSVKDLWAWIAIMVVACLSHPILDSCTIYGTQLLSPFSNRRFEISSVSIVDPFYSLMLILTLLPLLSKKLRPHARAIACIGIFLTTSYLVYGIYINQQAEKIATAQLEEQKITAVKVEAFTTIFQPYVRRVVVREPAGARVGFISTLAPRHIYWSCRKDVADDIKQAILATHDAQIFDWFSIGHLSFADTNIKDEYVVSDIRYGVPGPSVFGWWGQIYHVTKGADGQYIADYRSALHVERDASLNAISNLFKAMVGVENSFLPSEDIDCGPLASATQP